MIKIIGVIDRDTVESVKAEIAKSGDDVALLISSPGGDIMAGFDIYKALKESGKNITAQIIKDCASAATVIACAASYVEISDDAEYMIHNPYSPVGGDAENMKLAAEMLQYIQDTMLSVYAAKTGMDDNQIQDMMKAETEEGQGTFLNAAQAVSMGFCDKIMSYQRLVAMKENLAEKQTEKEIKESPKMEELNQEEKGFISKLCAFFKAEAEAPAAEAQAMEEEEAPEMEALKAELEALKAENEAMKAEAEAKASAMDEEAEEMEKAMEEKEEMLALAMSEGKISFAQFREFKALSIEDVKGKLEDIQEPAVPKAEKIKENKEGGDILEQYQALSGSERYSFYAKHAKEIDRKILAK